jgi:hypothetical protein
MFSLRDEIILSMITHYGNVYTDSRFKAVDWKVTE